MFTTITPLQARPIRNAVWLMALLLLVFPAFAAADPAGDEPVPRDLGDAPDSTNHAGVAMAAYPTVPANFPTVFDPFLGVPQGPMHSAPSADSWLGASVSAERDADLMPDADGVTNIAPPGNNPDNDWFDDGVFPVNPNNIALPQCQQTSFNYIVTGAMNVAPHQSYVNVWIDFNRDGDWADVLTCPGMVSVPEWAVQNQAVTVNQGSQVYATLPFLSRHPGGHAPTWMRITLSEQPAPQSAAGQSDGRGPSGGYATGETEDYLLFPIQAPDGGIVYCNNDN